MFVLLWWLVFSWQQYTHLYPGKNYVFYFLVKHISVFFNHVLLCVFFIICQCFVIYWDIYIYILYIHQRIDLRFCCGSVRLFLVHIVCFTDIFTSLHLNHHTCTSPKPTRSFYTNTLTKFNCFHSVRGCLFTLTATIDIAFFTIYLCLHLYYWTWTRYFEQKSSVFYPNGKFIKKKKSILKCKISVTTIYHIHVPVTFIPSHHLNRDLLNNLFTLIDCKQMDIYFSDCQPD